MNNLICNQHGSSPWTSLEDYNLEQIKMRVTPFSSWTSQRIKKNVSTGELKCTPSTSTKENTPEYLSVNSIESVFLDEHINNVLLIEDVMNKKQIQRNQKAILLIKSWLADTDPHARESDTRSLKETMEEIDKNRLSERKHFL